jgi:hypothetical protein
MNTSKLSNRNPPSPNKVQVAIKKQRKIVSPVATHDGVKIERQEQKQEQKPLTPRYDISAGDMFRPTKKKDIENFALDLIDSGERAICKKRDNPDTKIWIYEPIEKSRALGKKVPVWDDLKDPLDGSWEHRDRGWANVYEKYRTETIQFPRMHQFRKPAPCRLDVFITPNNVDMGGYVKFFFRPSAASLLYLVSFHGDNP